MFEATKEPTDLSDKEVRKALRKHLSPYQLKNLRRLASGRDHWRWHCGENGSRLAFTSKQLKGMLRRFSMPRDIVRSLIEHEPVGPALEPLILDGRWVARCECGGQEVVDPADPVFVCHNMACLNTSVNHKPRRVKFPSKKDRKKISEILLARPNPINRNYDPNGIVGDSDTIQGLELENIEHGLAGAVEVKEV